MTPLSRPLSRYAAALGWIVLATAAAEVLFRLTGTTRLSMVFLAGVLLTAFFQGSGPAYFAAALAFFVYNFYLVEPRFTVTFEAEDLINLVVFMAVAMLTGHLTGRIRDQAQRAEARAKATDALFQASREFSALSDEAAIRAKLAEHLAAACGGLAWVRDGSKTYSYPAGVDTPPDLPAAAALAADPNVVGATRRDPPWTLRSLRTAGIALGVAAWRAEPGQSETEDEQRLLELLADAGAAALGRARLAAAKAEAETWARTQELRNALLSSISHDLRTPLAAILASASSLRQFGEAFDLATREDLAATIEEEAERLDAFVANLLNMTRLEAGALTLERTAFSVREVVSRAVQRRGFATGRIRTAMGSADAVEALGDPVLFEQVLANVLENALRHTPATAGVLVTGRSDAGRVHVDVTDEGAGVDDADLPRLFEKFFRAPNNAHRGGTGLGLSIARGVMEAMQGDITARNRADGPTGLQVTLTLDAAP